MPLMLFNINCYVVLRHISVNLDSHYSPIFSQLSQDICVAILALSVTTCGFNILFGFKNITCILDDDDNDTTNGNGNIEPKRLDYFTYVLMPYIVSIINAVLLTVMYYRIFLQSIGLITIPPVDAYGFATKSQVYISSNDSVTPWMYLLLVTNYLLCAIYTITSGYIIGKKYICNSTQIIPTENT